MSILRSQILCEVGGVKTAGHAVFAAGAALMLAAFSSVAQPTNAAAETNTPPATTTNAVVETHETHVPEKPEVHATGFDEASFRIVSERNIFNANRSGTVNIPRSNSSTRSTRVDSFALVGTMAYEKGTFAFFEGSRSEYTKVLKPEGLIAGHKLVDVYASSVKMDVDGKVIELPIGSQLRREDEGAWHVSEGGGSYASNGGSGNGGDSSRYGSSRSDRDRYGSSGRGSRDYGSSRRGSDNGSSRSENSSAGNSSSSAPPAAAPTEEERNETLKKLMEKRAKEDQ